MSSATSGSNGIVHNFNPTGTQQSVGGTPGDGYSRSSGFITPPTTNRPLATPAIFAQTAALRQADDRYRTQPR